MATKQANRSAPDQQNTQQATQQATQQDDSNTVKNPDEWKTGDEPMTGAQRSYLKTLSDEANVPFDENLTKAEASKRIDELKQRSDRLAGGRLPRLGVPLDCRESVAGRGAYWLICSVFIWYDFCFDLPCLKALIL